MVCVRSGDVADCGLLMLEYQKSSAAASHLAFGWPQSANSAATAFG